MSLPLLQKSSHEKKLKFSYNKVLEGMGFSACISPPGPNGAGCPSSTPSPHGQAAAAAVPAAGGAPGSMEWTKQRLINSLEGEVDESIASVAHSLDTLPYKISRILRGSL
jgi:hypothetical protein